MACLLCQIPEYGADLNRTQTLVHGVALERVTNPAGTDPSAGTAGAGAAALPVGAPLRTDAAGLSFKAFSSGDARGAPASPPVGGSLEGFKRCAKGRRMSACFGNMPVA